MVDYAKRLVEVDEILNHLPDQYKTLIPKEIIEIIKRNKDKNYHWKFDNKKKLYQQDIPRETIAILSYINMEYLLNEEQKKYMQKYHLSNERRMNVSEDIFKNRSTEKNDTKDVLLIKTNKKDKIFEYIKRVFKRMFKIG